ncbi:MAG: carbamoyl phosphate synthase large subunit, partial [Pseudomonadota bacterium]
DTARTLTGLGFTLVATSGTAAYLAEAGIESEVVKKAYEGRPNIVDAMKDSQIALVMNTTEGAQAVEDSRSMRNVALMDRIPYYTTLAASHAAAKAMEAGAGGDLGVERLQR